MKNYLWKVYYTDGTEGAIYYCKKSELLDYLHVREWAKLDRVEIMNNAYDKVNHRPVSKEELTAAL